MRPSVEFGGSEKVAQLIGGNCQHHVIQGAGVFAGFIRQIGKCTEWDRYRTSGNRLTILRAKRLTTLTRRLVNALFMYGLEQRAS